MDVFWVVMPCRFVPVYNPEDRHLHTRNYLEESYLAFHLMQKLEANVKFGTEISIKTIRNCVGEVIYMLKYCKVAQLRSFIRPI
jgi:hypothetical protein